MTGRTASEILGDAIGAAEDHIAGNLAAGGVCDYCGGPLDGYETVWISDRDTKVRFLILGDEGETLGDAPRDYGKAWAACRTCDPVVALRDPQKLVDLVADGAVASGFPTARVTSFDDYAVGVRRNLFVVYTEMFRNGLKRVDITRVVPSSRDEALEQTRVLVTQAQLIVRRPGPGHVALHRRAVFMLEYAAKLNDQWHLELLDQADRDQLAGMRKLVSLEVNADARVQRRARLQARAAGRAPDVTPTGTLCSCGRAARVNGMCKKCARATGELPKGKQ